MLPFMESVIIGTRYHLVPLLSSIVDLLFAYVLGLLFWVVVLVRLVTAIALLSLDRMCTAWIVSRGAEGALATQRLRTGSGPSWAGWNGWMDGWMDTG